MYTIQGSKKPNDFYCTVIINVFMGSALSFYQCKNPKSVQILHTGPLRHTHITQVIIISPVLKPLAPV